ncbi:MAG TPA: penicillin acylase family protein [Thermomicrobiales bacterium]|nr:penicillin acylase family protein [Thermomicrobiales bacterium]
MAQPGPEAFAAALPDVTSTLTLAGLDQPVEIIRDHYGIPHIKAATLHDAFFAQGFVHAQDRLWQMEFDRRRAEGRWAECAGAPAIEQDRFMRRARIVDSAKADYDAFNDETKAMCDAYTAGVNAFIDTTKTLPVEYSLLDLQPRQWEPWISGGIFKVRHILMGLWGQKLWRARILKEHGPEGVAKLGVRGNEDGIVIVPPGEEYQAALADLDELIPGVAALTETPEFGGSNNWAVHGSRTRSGKPLVAGDPHRFLDVPSVYYQCQITCPDFDVVGYNFIGIPGFPHFAHNAHVAWCITHASADYQDLYVERFRPAGDCYQYEFQGEWQTATCANETIQVRGGQPVAVQAVVTGHGPVIIGDPASGHAIALRYSAMDRPNPGMTCFLPQLRAANLDELDEAMRNWVDPCNSMTMADVHGNIGYLHRGRVPVRNRANGWLPVPGWTGEHEWQGDIPFEELPRLRNPETGFVATANNRIVGPEYPHYLSLDYAPPHRARRVVARLSDLRDATIADMSAIHNDRISLPSRDFVAALGTLAPDDERTAAALDRLKSWDGDMDKSKVAPAIYAATRDQLARLVATRPYLSVLRENPFAGDPAPMGVEARLWASMMGMIQDNDTTLLADGETWEQLLGEALGNAVALLTEQLGENMDGWQWGKLHTTNPIHTLSGVFPELASTLNPPAVSIGGDGDTVQAAGTFPGQNFHVNGTSVTRYAFDLGDWDSSAWVVPLGASGHPGSPHFADQAVDWSEVRLNPMLYSWDKVAANAETTQRLQPA